MLSGCSEERQRVLDSGPSAGCQQADSSVTSNCDLDCFACVCFRTAGTSVMQVTATDADDPTYGNSARLVYSILQGQPYFSVEPQTGEI